MSRPEEGLRRGRGRARFALSSRATSRGACGLGVEPLEARRMLSVAVQGEVPAQNFRLLGITGNQQFYNITGQPGDTTDIRYLDETIYDIKFATPETPQALLLDGFEDISNPPDVALTTVTDVGVSQGNGALRAAAPQTPAPFWGVRSPNVVDLLKAGATELSYDMTLINRELNGGSFGGGTDDSFNGFAQSNELAVVIAVPSGGFIQRNFTTGGGTDSFGLNAQWSGVDGTRHITWDLTQFTAGPPEAPVSLEQFIRDNNATDARFWLVTQGADTNGNTGPMRFYFDNVVVSSDDFSALVGDFDQLYTEKVLTVPFVPDTDAIAWNPTDNLLYRTSGSASYRNDPERIGFHDNQFMQTINLDTLEQAGVFNSNPEGERAGPGGVPGTPTGPYGLPAPRPNWLFPDHRRLDTETAGTFNVEGPDEYEALRDFTWSAQHNAFYGTDERNIFKLTADGVSTKVGTPVGSPGGLKGILFATVNGETRLLVSEQSGPAIWTVDPETGQKVGDPVSLFHPVTFETPDGVLSLVQGPDGTLYGILKTDSAFHREIITIDLGTGEFRSLGTVATHMADLAIVPAQEPNVAEVYVRGATWTNAANASFMSYLEVNNLGDSELGYRVDNLTGAAPTLPWINVNQVVLRYSAPPTGGGIPQPTTVVLDGVRSDYNVTAVDQLDARTFVLTLDRSMGNQPGGGNEGDRVRLTVPDAGPGDSDYRITLNPLQGDADRNGGRVTALDLSFVKARQNRTADETPPAGLAAYSPYADFDTNGRINAIDLSAVKARQNDALPPAPAGGDVFGGTSITDEILLA